MGRADRDGARIDDGVGADQRRNVGRVGCMRFAARAREHPAGARLRIGDIGVRARRVEGQCAAAGEKSGAQHAVHGRHVKGRLDVFAEQRLSIGVGVGIGQHHAYRDIADGDAGRLRILIGIVGRCDADVAHRQHKPSWDGAVGRDRADARDYARIVFRFDIGRLHADERAAGAGDRPAGRRRAAVAEPIRRSGQGAPRERSRGRAADKRLRGDFQRTAIGRHAGRPHLIGEAGIDRRRRADGRYLEDHAVVDRRRHGRIGGDQGDGGAGRSSADRNAKSHALGVRRVRRQHLCIGGEHCGACHQLRRDRGVVRRRGDRRRARPDAAGAGERVSPGLAAVARLVLDGHRGELGVAKHVGGDGAVAAGERDRAADRRRAAGKTIGVGANSRTIPGGDRDQRRGRRGRCGIVVHGRAEFRFDRVVDVGFGHSRAEADIEAAGAGGGDRARGMAAAVVFRLRLDRQRRRIDDAAVGLRSDLLIDLGEADGRADAAAVKANRQRADDVLDGHFARRLDRDRSRGHAAVEDLSRNPVDAAADFSGQISAGRLIRTAQRAALIEDAQRIARRARTNFNDADGRCERKISADRRGGGDRVDVARAERGHIDGAWRGYRAARDQRGVVAHEYDKIDAGAEPGRAADRQAARGRIDGDRLLRLHVDIARTSHRHVAVLYGRFGRIGRDQGGNLRRARAPADRNADDIARRIGLGCRADERLSGQIERRRASRYAGIAERRFGRHVGDSDQHGCADARVASRRSRADRAKITIHAGGGDRGRIGVIDAVIERRFGVGAESVDERRARNSDPARASGADRFARRAFPGIGGDSERAGRGRR